MRGSFDDAAAPSERKTQFYSMLGSRSIWHEGWKAVTTHPMHRRLGPLQRRRVGALPHRRRPGRGATISPPSSPEKVRELVNIWFSEAGANGAFPLDDRSAVEIMNTPRPQLTAPRNRYVYCPGDAAGPRVAGRQHPGPVVRDRGAGRHPAPGAEGVLFAIGSRFGGHALYVKDNRLHYVNSFVGTEEQKVVGSEDIPTGENLLLSASFEKDGQEPTDATGTLSLYHGDTQGRRGQDQDPARVRSRSPAPALYVGRHSGEPVTDDYPGQAPYAFTGGTHQPGRGRCQRRAVHRPRAPGRDADQDSERDDRPTDRHYERTAILERHGDAPGDRRLRRARRRRGRAGLRRRRAERIAVFDNDGTLWCEKPMPIELGFILAAPRRDGRGRRVAARTQPWKAADEQEYAWLGDVITKHYHGDDSDVKVLMGGILQAFAGTTVEEYGRPRTRTCAARHPTLERPFRERGYLPMIELLGYLARRVGGPDAGGRGGQPRDLGGRIPRPAASRASPARSRTGKPRAGPRGRQLPTELEQL